MFDPTNDDSIRKLRTALEWSRREMRPYLDRAHDAWEAYVGHQYGQEGKSKKYVNLLAHGIDIFADRLASNPPLCSISPVPWAENARRIMPAAHKHERVVNSALRREKVERVTRLAIVNALFGVGAAKVGLKQTGETELGGEAVVTTGPYIQPILMEDLVIDMTSRGPEQMGYVGHRYQMGLEEARNNPDFDAEARKTLNPGEGQSIDPTSGSERLGMLGSSRGTEGSHRDLIELWEVFLPEEQLLLTFDHDFAHLLRTVEWTGPKHGPIHLLTLRRVPGNPMPRGLALDWVEMDDLWNHMFRKLAQQGKDTKTVFAAREGVEDDAQRLIKLGDGEVGGGFQDPAALEAIKLGGPDAGLFAFAMQVQDLFSKYAGNLDTLGGLSAESETLGQDQILNANASRLMESLGRELIDFTQGLITDYARYLWEDPVQTYPAERYIAGYGLLQDELTPEERDVDWFDMNLEIEPHSMGAQTPMAKLQNLRMFVGEMVLPMTPIMQQAGQALDPVEFFRQAAKLMGQPELERLITASGLPMDAQSATQTQPGTSTFGKPNGQYTRRNVSSGGGGDARGAAANAMRQAQQGAA